MYEEGKKVKLIKGIVAKRVGVRRRTYLRRLRLNNVWDDGIFPDPSVFPRLIHSRSK